MKLAKVTSKSQITIPKAIRYMLEIKDGSKIIFLEKDKDIIIKNSAMVALQEVQKAFEGEAERLGLETEEDVFKLINDYRKEKKERNKK